jgi:hypothetical protein
LNEGGSIISIRIKSKVEQYPIISSSGQGGAELQIAPPNGTVPPLKKNVPKTTLGSFPTERLLVALRVTNEAEGLKARAAGRARRTAAVNFMVIEL